MRSNKDKVLEILFFVVLFAVAAVSTVGLVLSHNEPIVIQGEIEADEIVIAGKLGGRIAQFYVSEGDSVMIGDTLVEIHSPEAIAKYQQAFAMESAARAQNSKIDHGTRKEIINSAQHLWQGTRAQLELARKSHQRIERLWADSVVSLQRRDESAALLQTALAAEQSAHQQYLMALAGAQKEDKQSAQAMVNAAEGVVNEVNAVLEDAHLVSPRGGIVSAIYPQAGELVAMGTPLLAITDLSRPYAIVMVREDLMPLFSLGECFVADIPAIGAEQVEFEVYYISPLGSYASWQPNSNRNNTNNYNMRTFELRAHPTTPIKGLRAGMSVVLNISLHE